MLAETEEVEPSFQLRRCNYKKMPMRLPCWRRTGGRRAITIGAVAGR